MHTLTFLAQHYYKEALKMLAQMAHSECKPEQEVSCVDEVLLKDTHFPGLFMIMGGWGLACFASSHNRTKRELGLVDPFANNL